MLIVVCVISNSKHEKKEINTPRQIIHVGLNVLILSKFHEITILCNNILSD